MKFRSVTAMPFRMPVPIIDPPPPCTMSTLPKDDHHVRHGVAEAHVFQDGQVDEARRADAITIRIRRCRR